MARLSNAMLAWWAAQPDWQTCHACGQEGRKHHVQPQRREGYALCVDCISDMNHRARIEHKAALDAMPRCEQCTRRATYTAGAGVLLCGRHLKAARAKLARSPMPWLPASDAVIRAAATKE